MPHLRSRAARWPGPPASAAAARPAVIDEPDAAAGEQCLATTSSVNGGGAAASSWSVPRGSDRGHHRDTDRAADGLEGAEQPRGDPGVRLRHVGHRQGGGGDEGGPDAGAEPDQAGQQHRCVVAVGVEASSPADRQRPRRGCRRGPAAGARSTPSASGPRSRRPGHRCRPAGSRRPAAIGPWPSTCCSTRLSRKNDG